MILLCEADEIAYRCAFACEKQAYIVHTKKQSKDFKNKYTKTDIIKFFKLKDKHIDVDYELEPYKIIEPEHIVKRTLKRRLERLWQLQHPEWGSGIDEVQLWLSPSDKSNFRYEVVNIMGAKGLGYKEGRGEKPKHLSLIKELMLERHGAQEIKGFEADDALGIYANENTVLSHVDKDIDMIGGCWHYHHIDDIIYYVDPGIGSISLRVTDAGKKKIKGNGLLFFYTQLLTGDSIDNIPGCDNPAKAHHKKPPKFSDEVAFDLLQGITEEQVAFNYVKQMFEFTYEDRWLEAIEECADLLWICKRKDETGRQYLKNRGFI